MSHKNRDRLSRQALNETTAPFEERQQPVSFATRSGSASGLTTTAANGYKRGSNSPLRGSRDNSHGNAYSRGPQVETYGASGFGMRSGSSSGFHQSSEMAQMRSSGGAAASRQMPPMASRPPIPQHDNYVRQKSPKSPLRQKTLGGSRSPTRDIDMRDASHGLLTASKNQREGHVSPVRSASNEYIMQLRQDNVSLQKRLNLVLQELDRVSRDRSNLVQKLSNTDQEVNALQSRLNAEDEADRRNNEFQLDLNGHRDQNVNVKRSIAETDV